MKPLFRKPACVFWVAVLVLWLNFSGHLLSTLPLKKYIDGEFPSERYVFSRLIHSLEHGASSEGGFMLAHNHVDDLYKSVEREDYADFKQRLEAGEDGYTLYLSHAGLQDDLVLPIWRALDALKGAILEKARPGSRWHGRLQRLDYYYYNLMSQTLVALLNALVIAGFALWAARQFTSVHGWLVLGLMIVSMPVLTFYGRSMWWMMWSWFAPCLLVLWVLFKGRDAQERAVPPLPVLLGLSAVCGGLICMRVLMGYEFVAPTMMGILVAIAFYSCLYSWGWQRWFYVSFVVGLGALIGALCGMALHYNALEAYGLDPLDVMRGRYEMRAYGGESLAGMGGEIPRSTQASFLSVLAGYLISPKELAIPQLLFMAPFLCWLWGYVRGGRMALEEGVRRLYDGFIAAIGLGMLGGIAMLAILKGHAYIHGYDIVIWAIPTNIFLLIFYAQRLLR